MKNLLIDGNHLAYRCKFTHNLSNNGMDVSVTYGFIRVLLSLVSRFEIDGVFVGWDGGVPEFRRKVLPVYKANRHNDDDPLEREDFMRQIYELHDYALPRMGIISVMKYGAEADDLVYHASRMLQGYNLIVTSDKDLLQAVNAKVAVYHPSKDKVYEAEDITEEFGIDVKDMVDWRALQGDGSDNIPGVYGIGEKTATKLFNEFHTLTGIYNAAMGRNPEGKLTGKIADNIAAFGFDNIVKNISIMALYADRVGARLAIIDGLSNYRGYDYTAMKKYFFRNAFMSLMDTKYYKLMGGLSKPKLRDMTGIRTPVVCDARYPV